MSRIREQNRRLAFQALREAFPKPWFWGPILLALGLHLTRTQPWLPLLGWTLLLVFLALWFLVRMGPDLFLLDLDPKWATYRETRRLRQEVERLRKSMGK